MKGALKLTNEDTKRILTPIYENIERSKEMVSFAIEKGWSEDEFKKTIELLHSIYKTT